MLAQLKADIQFCINVGFGPARGGVAKRLPSGVMVRYPFHWMVYGMCLVHHKSSWGVSLWFRFLRWVLIQINLVSWRIMKLNGLIE